MGKNAPFFLLLASRTGEGGGERRRRPIRAPWAEAAAGTEGEREREPRWIDPRPHLERWWRVAAWLLRPAAAELQGRRRRR